MGQGEGEEVNWKASQEGQAEDECSVESQDCGGSQGALEEGQGSGEKFAVANS